MIKVMQAFCILFFSLTFLMAQNTAASLFEDPIIVEEMQLKASDVQRHKIKSVSLNINNTDSTTQLKWVNFNQDGTVSEYNWQNDYRRFNYTYDKYGRLKSLEDIDILAEDDVGDTVIRSYSYSKNHVKGEYLNQGFYYEWMYLDSTYTIVLEKRLYRAGELYSVKQYEYDEESLVKIVFKRDDRLYSEEHFSYNDHNLLVKESCINPWNGAKDSTIFYYGDDMVLDSIHQGHFRSGENQGLIADWQEWTLFNENGKWFKKRILSKDGEILELIERFFNGNGLLIREEHLFVNEDRKKVITYDYKYYDE